MTQFCQISPSVSREPDDQANNEDEDEDNEALGDGTADHEVVPAHVGRPLRLHILLHFLLRLPWQAWWQVGGGRLGQAAASQLLVTHWEDYQPILAAGCLLLHDDMTIGPAFIFQTNWF